MICLITNRHQRAPIEQASEAADAGVDLIQVRERDLEAGELSALVERIMAATRGSATRVVVNDRVDVAIACGAAGVHLRGDSMSAARVRTMTAAGFLIGCSVRSPEEALSAAPDADYLIAGTVFPTSSKPGMRKLLGLQGLAAIATAVPVPVLAVGGVSTARAGEIAATGAAGVAAIGLFADPHRPIREVVRLLQEQFGRV
jgi:thiamine-phosphate pyrophosphorylase